MKGTQSWMSPLCSNEEEPTSKTFRDRAAKKKICNLSNYLLYNYIPVGEQRDEWIIHPSIPQLGYTKRRTANKQRGSKL